MCPLSFMVGFKLLELISFNAIGCNEHLAVQSINKSSRRLEMYEIGAGHFFRDKLQAMEPC